MRAVRAPVHARHVTADTHPPMLHQYGGVGASGGDTNPPTCFFRYLMMPASSRGPSYGAGRSMLPPLNICAAGWECRDVCRQRCGAGPAAWCSLHAQPSLSNKDALPHIAGEEIGRAAAGCVQRRGNEGRAPALPPHTLMVGKPPIPNLFLASSFSSAVASICGVRSNRRGRWEAQLAPRWMGSWRRSGGSSRAHLGQHNWRVVALERGGCLGPAHTRVERGGEYGVPGPK